MLSDTHSEIEKKYVWDTVKSSKEETQALFYSPLVLCCNHSARLNCIIAVYVFVFYLAKQT